MRHPTRPRVRPCLEELETRFAPATLVSPHQVTYQDIDGDAVTIIASKAIFTDETAANAILNFSTGIVNGSNATPQQLRKVDLTVSALAKGTDLTITAEPAGGGQGLAHVGHIAAAGRDLGKVTIDGDLGRVEAGNGDMSTPGLVSLKVGSLGLQGTATQLPGGNLNTDIQGKLGALVVSGNIQDAFVSVHGGPDKAGIIGRIVLSGDLIGGTALQSGSILATGHIGPIDVTGNLVGGAGNSSGSIVSTSTSKGLGAIEITGDLIGGGGNTSGSFFSNGPIGDVVVGGSLLGGGGDGSGQIYANGTMGEVFIGGSLVGGAGGTSGRLRAGKAVPRIEIMGSLVGASIQSGGVEAFKSLGTLIIHGDVTGGTSLVSGRIFVGGRLKRLVVDGTISSGTGTRSGYVEVGLNLVKATIGNLVGTATDPVVISAFGERRPVVGADVAIGTLTVTGQVQFATIRAGYGGFTPAPANADASIGRVEVTGDWIASNLVAGGIAEGPDGNFGTPDDVLASGGSSSRRAKVGTVVIGGAVSGTAVPATDHFGFVAEVFGSLSVNGSAVALTSGAHNDDLPLGSTGDVRLLEL